MFYMQYLSSLCQRRQWPQPIYDPYPTRSGVRCVVRVNNREYHTDTIYESEVLARENAAMRAYLICRNFSVNDGMYPSGHNRGGVLQGMPVAIGTERRSVYVGGGGSSSGEDAGSDAGSASGSGSGSISGSVSSGSRSGESSPSYDPFPQPQPFQRPSHRDSTRRRSEMARALTYGGGRRR